VGANDDAVVTQMQEIVECWRAEADQRSVFLGCYEMMTRNMLDALGRSEFRDNPWVDRLLHRFADYYFEALRIYERAPHAVPLVWRLAHDAARDPEASALQRLLLGVNAHINYDLVLTLVELLDPTWAALPDEARCTCRADYDAVNEIIARTIDAVQDTVLEPAMPELDSVDNLLGPVDELLTSRLVTHWRDRVWEHAERVLATTDSAERLRVVRDVEANALRLADAIIRRDLATAIRELV